MRGVRDRAGTVAALRHAAPYIRLFKGKVFVLKAGGEAFETPETARAFLEQAGLLHQLGIRVVIVHGGGAQSTRLAERLGIETTFADGRRVTDGDALDVAAMALNGSVNTGILAVCRSLDIPAVGVSGVDAGLISARRRPPVPQPDGSTVDYGFVGDIESVDPHVLRTQLDEGMLPIVSPLSCDASGTVLNINADTVAAAIAVALDAEKLILATGAPGILGDRNDPKSIISYLDRKTLRQMGKDGKLSDGMLPKAAAIEDVLAKGVRRVHIISCRAPDTLLLEVFTNEGTGTLVVNDIDALSAAEQAS